MGTQFQSAVKRSFWLGVAFSAIIDFGMAFAITLFFNDTAGAAFVVAILIWLGFYLIQFLYGLLGLLKGAILFFGFERKARVAATVDQMAAVKMPKPMQFYTDAEEYLTEVVKSDTAKNEAKLFAGATIGGLETLKTTNHGFLAAALSIVLEKAIREYGERTGFVWDDGTAVAPEDILDR